jgi:DNA-binding transcriptional MerR regulator
LVVAEAEDFMTEQDVAELLRVPVRRVRQWRKRGIIPGRVQPKGTRLALYRRAEVVAWLKKGGGR